MGLTEDDRRHFNDNDARTSLSESTPNAKLAAQDYRAQNHTPLSYSHNPQKPLFRNQIGKK